MLACAVVGPDSNRPEGVAGAAAAASPVAAGSDLRPGEVRRGSCQWPPILAISNLQHPVYYPQHP